AEAAVRWRPPGGWQCATGAHPGRAQPGRRVPTDGLPGCPRRRKAAVRPRLPNEQPLDRRVETGRRGARHEVATPPELAGRLVARGCGGTFRALFAPLA